ncbi:SDR family oxidoreductase [Ferruginibacter sp. SUN106]|uniref:SDR family oxidoreductase n=1 Tax=Ferruginibacter sp. SUN106 TaxID=2978348 RepID=UPI003D369304
MNNNQKKVALITGANRGLGFETAKQLGEQGITVVLAARQLSSAKIAAEKLIATGIDAYAIQLDVTKAADRTAAATYLTEKFGKLDILINNAGVAPKTAFEPRNLDTSAEEFEYIFNTNLFSIVYLTKELIPLLKKSDAGRIVNLSSILGSLGVHSQEDSPIAGFRILSYNASKASLNMFTVQLAEELKGTSIKVNSAHPGWVKTDMGGDEAPMAIVDGAKTSVQLALVGEDGPSGKFIHLGEELPW